MIVCWSATTFNLPGLPGTTRFFIFFYGESGPVKGIYYKKISLQKRMQVHQPGAALREMHDLQAGYSSYCFIFSQRFFRLIPSTTAASVLFPPVFFSAR